MRSLTSSQHNNPDIKSRKDDKYKNIEDAKYTEIKDEDKDKDKD